MRTLLLGLLFLGLSFLFGCGRESAQRASAAPEHGLVGLRPLPRSPAEAVAVAGPGREGLPLFDRSLTGTYPFVAAHLDVLYGGFEGDEFATKKVFFEFYIGLGGAHDSRVPKDNLLIQTIRTYESQGYEVHHILICREYRLMKEQGFPDAVPGPFPEDTRILSAEDVQVHRSLFRDAHALGLVRKPDYALIQMVEDPSFFATEPRVLPILKTMQGVAFEVHQFNRHWPLATGWSKPASVVTGARWAVDHDLDYIFYYGPILWTSDDYHPFIEREWLETFWKAGLPKRHPRVHYYLNLFPHAHGCGRPVGPESDPHSILGFTKWVIEEVGAGTEGP